MTTYAAKMNELNILTANRSTGNGVNNQHDTQSGPPIRFIPVEAVAETSNRHEWTGSHGVIYRTKTGKLVAVLTDYSSIDGHSDSRTVLTGDSEKQLFERLASCEFEEADALRAALASTFEVVPTL
jgi:hypothetical protein